MILTREQIDACFEDKTHQKDVVEALYRLIYPDWDEIESLERWPTCGQEVGSYVVGRMVDFDRQHHPQVVNGGLWMNCGWSVSSGLQPWEVLRCKAVYIVPV